MSVANTPEKVWKRLNKEGDCWLWEGNKSTSGYGVMYVDNRRHKIHRLTYELTYGEIPEGHHVHHKCKTKLCGRPEHLSALSGEDHNEHHAQEKRK